MATEIFNPGDEAMFSIPAGQSARVKILGPMGNGAYCIKFLTPLVSVPLTKNIGDTHDASAGNLKPIAATAE